MVWVAWRAVLGNWGSRAIALVELVVTLGAQRAKCAQAEQSIVTSVRLDVVSDGCWCNAASF
jgi:hypothetical protein